jgi:hypothetical protein
MTKKLPSNKRPGQNWPADEVERRKIKDLIPYAKNSRTHSEGQIGQIAAAITEWGFANPILIAEDGTIIAGHGRVMAAKKLGLAEVPVMIARGRTDSQKRAFVIADNKITLNGGWDDTVLKAEFADLTQAGFDTALLAFAPGELVGIGPVDGIEDAPASKYSEQYGVIVICADEAGQKATYERLNSEGLNCKVVTT